MKIICFTIFTFSLLFISCTNAPSTKDPILDKNIESDDVQNIQTANKTDTLSTYRKYNIKSGVITFKTTMNTKTVNITYRTVVSFDQFGMIERRDTYDGDVLSETFLSDGHNNYNISHKNKKIVLTGKAYRGTESKFGWDMINEEDLKSGKVFKNTIPRNIRLAEAPSHGLAIGEYDRWSKGARAYKAVTKEVLERVG